MAKKQKDPTVISAIAQIEGLSEEEIDTRVKNKIEYGNKLLELQKRNAAAWARYQTEDPELTIFLENTDRHIDEHKASRNELLAKIATKKQAIEKLVEEQKRVIPAGRAAPTFIAPSS